MKQKITFEQAQEIRALNMQGYTNKQLTEIYNVHSNTIYLILRNKLHTGKVRYKLTETDKENIKREYYNNVDIRQIDLANKYNVHVNTIQQCLRSR